MATSLAIIMIYERSNNVRVVNLWGDNGTMIWGDIGYRGMVKVKFIAGKLNGKKCIET